eukprot:1757969-Prorocentrum_lima.AAC.1
MELKTCPTPVQVYVSIVSINMVRLLLLSGSFMSNGCVGAITASFLFSHIKAVHDRNQELFAKKG